MKNIKHAEKNRKHWYTEWLTRSQYKSYGFIRSLWDGWLNGLCKIEFCHELNFFADVLFHNFEKQDHVEVFLGYNPDYIRNLVRSELRRIAVYLKANGSNLCDLQASSDRVKGNQLLKFGKKMNIISESSKLNDFIQG